VGGAAGSAIQMTLRSFAWSTKEVKEEESFFGGGGSAFLHLGMGGLTGIRNKFATSHRSCSTAKTYKIPR